MMDEVGALEHWEAAKYHLCNLWSHHEMRALGVFVALQGGATGASKGAERLSNPEKAKLAKPREGYP